MKMVCYNSKKVKPSGKSTGCAVFLAGTGKTSRIEGIVTKTTAEASTAYFHPPKRQPDRSQRITIKHRYPRQGNFEERAKELTATYQETEVRVLNTGRL
ncbi:hypothetical protein CS542_09385 [Pedobacter sp. IW39]|nr:hypothetical protein CS542_09385 [Pedobacter sp. IW39]